MSGASRPLVNPAFAQLKAVLLCRFLAVKERPLDAFDFYKRAQTARTEDVPCEYQSNPVAKLGNAEPPVPHCTTENFVVNLKYFSLH